MKNSALGRAARQAADTGLGERVGKQEIGYFRMSFDTAWSAGFIPISRPSSRRWRPKIAKRRKNTWRLLGAGALYPAPCQREGGVARDGPGILPRGGAHWNPHDYERQGDVQLAWSHSRKARRRCGEFHRNDSLRTRLAAHHRGGCQARPCVRSNTAAGRIAAVIKAAPRQTVMLSA
jgi:hypothetical protein